ncbi:hypothetical protein HC928_03790 [bacterium]|nr:hypothetical protein [bacterium]
MFVKQAVELVLSNGVTVRVTPLSAAVMAGINRKANLLFPSPEPPRVPMQGALDPSQTVPDYTDKAYQAQVNSAQVRRLNYIADAMYRIGVTDILDYETVLDHWRDDVTRYQAWADVEDDRHAVLDVVVLSHDEDAKRIVQALRGNLPLDAGEVADGLRVFRPVVAGPASD